MTTSAEMETLKAQFDGARRAREVDAAVRAALDRAFAEWVPLRKRAEEALRYQTLPGYESYFPWNVRVVWREQHAQ